MKCEVERTKSIAPNSNLFSCEHLYTHPQRWKPLRFRGGSSACVPFLRSAGTSIELHRYSWHTKLSKSISSPIFFANFSHFSRKTMANHTKIIRLLWFFPTEFRTAMSNPRPACGPGEGFVRPSKLFIIVYVQDNDSLSLFWSSQIRHFRCSRLYCLVGRSWQFHHRLLALQPQGVEPHQKAYRQVCKLL